MLKRKILNNYTIQNLPIIADHEFHMQNQGIMSSTDPEKIWFDETTNKYLIHLKKKMQKINLSFSLNHNSFHHNPDKHQSIYYLPPISSTQKPPFPIWKEQTKSFKVNCYISGNLVAERPWMSQLEAKKILAEKKVKRVAGEAKRWNRYVTV